MSFNRKKHMKQKFYAVRKGQTTGVFLTWDECKNAVHGFAGAEYKSFATRKEAEDFIALGQDKTFKGDKNISDPMFFATEETLVAFVDGSFDVNTGSYAFGCVLIEPNGTVTEKNGSGNEEEAKSARNVAGELLGTMTAAAFAIKNGYKKLRVYHDYTGICKWYRKEWKAESFAAREYVEFMNKTRPVLETEFVKVEAHTGVFFNERADILAKEALGIR